MKPCGAFAVGGTAAEAKQAEAGDALSERSEEDG
jgi:hypothetical protein